MSGASITEAEVAEENLATLHDALRNELASKRRVNNKEVKVEYDKWAEQALVAGASLADKMC